MADVLHRTTKVLLRSMNTPDYPTAQWIISPDLSAVSGVPAEEWVIEGDAVRAMTTAEKDAQLLTVVKQRKLSVIDGRTAELVSAGYEHPAASGQMFSLGAETRNLLVGMDLLRDDPAFVYPVDWNTIDGMAKITLDDATEVHNFFLTSVGVYRDHLDSGTALKDSVRAATTITAVNAVVDNR